MNFSFMGIFTSPSFLWIRIYREWQRKTWLPRAKILSQILSKIQVSSLLTGLKREQYLHVDAYLFPIEIIFRQLLTIVKVREFGALA